MVQQRNLSIDLIKTIAMLSVICLHTTYQYIQPNTFGLADILYKSAVISIPLFFMVSGYLLLGRENLSYKYSLSKILKIVRFVFFITLSYWIIHSLISHNFEVKDFFKIFLGSFIQRRNFGIFWYLGAMIIIYSILPLINKLYKNSMISFAVLVMVCFLCSTSIFLQNVTNRGGEALICQTFRLYNWLFYFCIGGVIKRIPITPTRIIFIFSAILFIINIVIQEWLIPYIGNEFCEYFYSSPYVMLLSICLFILVLHSKFKCEKLIKLLSNLFLPVYTFHMFIIKYITSYFNFGIFIDPLISWMVVSLITILLSSIIIKTPVIKDIFKL